MVENHILEMIEKHNLLEEKNKNQEKLDEFYNNNT